MACSLNLQASLDWASPFIRFQPFTIGGMEPALTAAQMTLETILGPPFTWRWNRSTLTFACQAGVQDYVVQVADFGFEEVASIADTSEKNTQITFNRVLALDGSANARPAYIAVQNDDNAGNLTFRLSPPPDLAYEVTVTYQRKAPMLFSLGDFWTPVPDEYAYIYNWGLLTMAAMLATDARMPAYSQKFVGHLLGVQSGLTERQINIFLATYLQRTGQVAVAGMTAQQGVTARTF